MIGPVVAFALPTLPDATAPIAAPRFAEILAIQSPMGSTLPTLPAAPATGEVDPVTTPVDFTIPAAVIAHPLIGPVATPIAVPVASARPDSEVAPSTANVATLAVSHPLPHERRPVGDERDEDSVAPVADTAPVPIPAWLAPQPPIQSAATLPKREAVAPRGPDAVAARVSAKPEVTGDAATLEPDVMHALPSLPDARRVTTVAAPPEAGEPADSPIDVPVGRAPTNLASVVTQSTAPAPGPTQQSVAPNSVSPTSVPQTSTPLVPARGPVVEAVPTPTATTPLIKVEHPLRGAGPTIIQPPAAEQITLPPEGLPQAHPAQPKPDDTVRIVDAIPVNVAVVVPALPPSNAPAPAKQVPTVPAQPAPHDPDPLPTPAFAIATPALGEVSAAVTARHDGTGERLHVHFAVERDATAALIAGHDGLDRAVAAAGARLDTVSVEVRGATERSSGDAPRPDPRAPDPDRPRRPPPPRSPQLRVAAPGRDRFA